MCRGAKGTGRESVLGGAKGKGCESALGGAKGTGRESALGGRGVSQLWGGVKGERM